MRPDNLKLRIVSNGEKFRVEAWASVEADWEYTFWGNRKEIIEEGWILLNKEGNPTRGRYLSLEERKPAEFSTRNAALGWIKQKFGETALDHAVVPAEWRP